MRIVKITSGLGNQLFQYAFARVVSIETNEKVMLDISNYKFYSDRLFSLNLFNLFEFKYINSYFYFILFIFIYKLNKFWPYLFKNIYFEKYPCNYNSKLPSNKFYFQGYFQSEKYFNKYRPLLLNEITLKKPLNSKYISILNNNNNTVSIHVRRGDYLNELNKSIFITFSSDYYFDAIKLIVKKVKNPFFLIFSDDIVWCKKNLNIDYPHLFINSSSPEQDLILMSKCKHNIISNSSFSWWGAWLNKSRNKIVIAPKKWMNKNLIYYKDICPNYWVRI